MLVPQDVLHFVEVNAGKLVDFFVVTKVFYDNLVPDMLIRVKWPPYEDYKALSRQIGEMWVMCGLYREKRVYLKSKGHHVIHLIYCLSLISSHRWLTLFLSIQNSSCNKYIPVSLHKVIIGGAISFAEIWQCKHIPLIYLCSDTTIFPSKT